MSLWKGHRVWNRKCRSSISFLIPVFIMALLGLVLFQVGAEQRIGIENKAKHSASKRMSRSNEAPEVSKDEAPLSAPGSNSTEPTPLADQSSEPQVRQTRATTVKKTEESTTRSPPATTTKSSAVNKLDKDKEEKERAKDRRNKVNKDDDDDSEDDNKSTSGKSRRRKLKSDPNDDDDDDDDYEDDDKTGRDRDRDRSSKRKRRLRHRGDQDYEDSDYQKGKKTRSSSSSPSSPNKRKRPYSRDDSDDLDDDEPANKKKHNKSSQLNESNGSTNSNSGHPGNTTTTTATNVGPINGTDQSHINQQQQQTPNSNLTNTNENLDQRSPSSSFSKRLNDKLKASRNQLQPTTNQPNKTNPVSAPSYNNITKMNGKPETGVYVQILNQTTDSNGKANQQHQILQPNTNLTDLDWSKLVKVVFKSALDNQTLYTVVMNSSELNKHPINDWSNELPQLLDRDFEKLVDKWSSVFPPDNLLTDISRIIVQRIAAMPNSTLANRINETLSFSRLDAGLDGTSNHTAGHSRLNTTIRPLLDLLFNNKTDGLMNETHSQPDDQDWSRQHNGSSLLGNHNVSTQMALNSSQFNSSSPSPLSMSTSKSDQQARHHSRQAPSPGGKTTGNPANTGLDAYLTGANQSSLGSNKTLIDVVNGMNVEHVRIESNVKESADSLRHFIIICSVASVIGTSAVVAIIIFLFKR